MWSLFTLFTLLTFTGETLFVVNSRIITLNFPLTSSLKILLRGKNFDNFHIKGDTLFIDAELKEGDTLMVIYKKLPMEKIYRRKILEDTGSLKEGDEGEERRVERSGGIEITGVKRFGLTMEEGISLDQATQIRVGGEVGKGVKMEGVLSDRRISKGERVTATLQELEQVYLRAESDWMKLQLGDFTIDNFGGMTRMEGFNVSFSSRRGTFEGVYGFERGVYNSITFYAEDGFQGPYLLKGKGGQEDISIIPGTERVYVNGELVKAGRDADYIINYEEATITFTPKRLLSSRDRITVDFQYRSDEWKRVFGRASLSSEVKNNRIGVLYLEMGVDPELPQFLMEEDLNFLKIIGDSVEGNEISGARYVGSGMGDYIKEGEIFVFVGEGNGDYRVHFTYVGEGNGDYIFDNQTGGFKYIGEEMGEYLPIMRINPPDRLRLLKLSDEGSWGRAHYIIALNVSDYDGNIISPLDDGDNRGYGFKGNFGWEGNFFGKLLFEGSYLFRDSRFRMPVRELGPDVEYEWLQKEEREKERESSLFKLSYSPLSFLTLGGEGGFLRQGKKITLKRGGYLSFNGKISGSLFLKNLIFNDLFYSRYGGDLKIPYRKNTLTVGVLREEGDTLDILEYWGKILFNPSLYIKLKGRKEGGKRSRFAEIGSQMNRDRISYDFTYDYVQSGVENNHFLSLSWKYILSHTTLWGSHLLNSDRVKKEEERYIYVGEGKGDFSLDPETGIFVPDPFGDYIREIVAVEEGERAVLSENLLGLKYNPKTFHLLLNLSIEGKGTSFSKILGKDFLRKEYNFRADFSLEPSLFFITPVFGLDYLREEKREFGEKLKTLYSIDGELNFPLIGKLLKGGFGTQIDVLDEELNHYRRRELNLEGYFKLNLSIPKGLLSIKLGEERRRIQMGIFDKLGYSLYFEPSYSGKIRGFILRSDIRFLYGWMREYFLFPTIPEGFGVYYNINVRKDIKRDLRFRFDLMGRRGKSMQKRERISLSLELQF
jgi:hypothetical protein